ncbi:EVE domain-containing protein [Picosynechococcus sp. PCC 11901]|uniref:EVE domain-containing protein n=1 Tax=Picosynechococcus sp. PCC 11901 TaxID=2579791 RepID=UPI0010FC0691|nr:EVE domain-containing protein [Picosynechococcus sp. PCC 11901]QCS49791.1 EVE domain-containing protein [Picosynechococcus sp. PCC 11901]
MAYWLFQGNPRYHRVLDAIREQTEMPWLVTRYKNKIQVGDGVLIWMAGEAAGIYAIAEIISLPTVISSKNIQDLDYWTDPKRLRADKPRSQIRFIRKLLGQPLRKIELRFDGILRDLDVIHTPSSTNFKITPEQWLRVHQLKG